MKKVKLLQIIAIILIAIYCMSLSTYAISYKYDELGRLIETSYDSGQKITYTYDATGNIVSSSSTDVLITNLTMNKPATSINVGQTEQLNAIIHLKMQRTRMLHGLRSAEARTI